MEQLITKYPNLKNDIIEFNDYVKQLKNNLTENKQIAFEWHLRDYPNDIQEYFYHILYK